MEGGLISVMHNKQGSTLSDEDLSKMIIDSDEYYALIDKIYARIERNEMDLSENVS